MSLLLTTARIDAKYIRCYVGAENWQKEYMS